MLPVYVDWKKAAESNAIIFRRGYSTESQKGLLLVEKLDYLQSRRRVHIFRVGRVLRRSWRSAASHRTLLPAAERGGREAKPDGRGHGSEHAQGHECAC